MRILLTGGAGYIGSHTSLRLLDAGYQVTILDNLVNGTLKLIPKKAKFLNSDISDEDKVSKLLKNNQFDIIIHFAAYTKVGESVEFPEKYIDNNFNKAKIFLNTCIEHGLNKIIFSSTGSVYGNVSKENILETDNTAPINPYSESKLKFEKHLELLSKENVCSSIILRYFNVAGADKDLRSGLLTNPDNLIKAICEVATKKREKLIINGKGYKTKDGTTIRDFIHVSDLAEMHLLAARNLIDDLNISSNIFNCGYGKGYSIKDVVDEMNKILQHNINYEFGPNRLGDASHSVADVTKFVKKFQWKPKYNDLNAILKSALDWEKKI
jgi:UDP-glucose 4-epimerase